MILLKQCAWLMIGITVFAFAMEKDHVGDQVRIDYNKIAQQRSEEQRKYLNRRYFHRYEESSSSEDDRPFHKGEKKVRRTSKL
jgi:hypothetical protein